uniref:Uncharacterized protein n=1 Tax=Ustilago esculenta TaxID=185366 RepID=A0A481SFS8_9BASI|nr:hypothetical protein UEMT_2034 [Ustilago esculenta]
MSRCASRSRQVGVVECPTDLLAAVPTVRFARGSGGRIRACKCGNRGIFKLDWVLPTIKLHQSRRGRESLPTLAYGRLLGARLAKRPSNNWPLEHTIAFATDMVVQIRTASTAESKGQQGLRKEFAIAITVL